MSNSNFNDYKHASQFYSTPPSYEDSSLESECTENCTDGCKFPEIDAIIGSHLKDIRKLKGLTQEEYGKLVNISAQQMQKYEKGINSISASKLSELSRVLKLPITTFYNGLSLDLGENSQSPYTTNHCDSDIENDNREFNEFMRAYLQLNIKERRKLLRMVKAWVDAD